MNGERTQSRRGFFNWIFGTGLAGLAAMVVYPVARFISPPKIPEAASQRVLAGTLSDLEKEPWKIFKFGSQPGLLIRTETGELRAFSATCTHLDCTVQYRSDQHQIWCACHNGFYDLNGTNVAGPPPRPLTAYEVNVEGEEIFVSRS